jgi:hypothetical protein
MRACRRALHFPKCLRIILLEPARMPAASSNASPISTTSAAGLLPEPAVPFRRGVEAGPPSADRVEDAHQRLYILGLKSADEEIHRSGAYARCCPLPGKAPCKDHCRGSQTPGWSPAPF